jgi:hypothetical protein
MTTRPDDAAAMFDLSPLPESSQAAESSNEAAEAIEAEEAALAAELASSIESGEFANDAPDSRTELRVKVAWPARMRLPDGRVIELRLRDISEGGVGLMSDEHIPAYTVVDFAMDIPPLHQGGKATPVSGTIKTTYTLVHGSETLCGGTWLQLPPAALELVNAWIKRLSDEASPRRTRDMS